MMPSPAEYLNKHLVIEKEIITFRHLSRALSIHVNVAKNELDSFHTSSKGKDDHVYATYLLTGDAPAVSAYGAYRDDNEIEVDNELEMIPTTKILLVGEDELEAAKAQFARLSSVHIYSLSPSTIKDATLLTTSADYVRSQYVDKGKEFHQMLGIVVGADVKVRALASKKGKASSASSSKLKLLPQDKKPADKQQSSDSKVKEVEKKESKKGTLDWSKAKSKEENSVKGGTKPSKDATMTVKKIEKEETDEEAQGQRQSKRQEVKEEELAKNGPDTKKRAASKKKSMAALRKDKVSKAAVKLESEESEVDVKKEEDAHEKPKRGKKRPSALLSLSESDEDERDNNNPTVKTKSRTSDPSLPSKPAPASDKNIRVKKGALVSDEEEEARDLKSEALRRDTKGKGRAILSDDEDGADRSVRTMMDLEDSHFIRHNKPSTKAQAREEEEEEEPELEKDIEMCSDSDPVPAPKRKRRSKKVVPIGRNGLPKKRVVKSRKSKDARGYTVTQDYSSYESASESEHVLPAKGSEKKSKRSKRDSNHEKGDVSLSVSEKPAASKARQKPRPYTNRTAEGATSSTEKSKLSPNSVEATSKVQRAGSGSNGSTKSTVGETTSNSGKNNLMSYFGKK